MKHSSFLQQLEAPFAWLDLEALEANSLQVKKMASTKKIRIATKSIRSVDVLKNVATLLGEQLSGWMTYSAAETAFLCEKGFDHFLLGYPTMETTSVRALLQWIQKGKDITFMVDCEAHMRHLNELALERNVSVNICIDINVSLDLKAIYFGTRRSSVTNELQLKKLIQQSRSFGQLHITSLMGYDAQLAGVGDKPLNKAKGMLIRQLQKKSKSMIQAQRQKAVQLVERHVGPLQFVNGGGSGSLRFNASCPEVTEITVGSALYKPALFDAYKEMPFQQAAGFCLRVTRQPDAQTIVLHGGGYIASGAISVDKMPKPLDEQLEFFTLEGAGEVQTPMKQRTKTYNIGDLVFFRHSKAGELCERFQVLHTFNKNGYVGPYQTYRGEGQCFL